MPTPLSASTPRKTAGLNPARFDIVMLSSLDGSQSSWRTAVIPMPRETELPQGGDAGKRPCSARTRVDHVAYLTGVVVPGPFELVDRSPQYASDHVALPVSNGETGYGFGM